MTHTVATLDVSSSTYAEITQKLRAAGYDHVFDGELIDMTGIGLMPAPPEPIVAETFVTDQGQRFFRYPERVQPIDHRSTADMARPSTADALANLQRVMREPQRGWFKGAELRLIDTNIPALQGKTFAEPAFPLVLDRDGFLGTKGNGEGN
jgi:hypothetical protein